MTYLMIMPHGAIPGTLRLDCDIVISQREGVSPTATGQPVAEGECKSGGNGESPEPNGRRVSSRSGGNAFSTPGDSQLSMYERDSTMRVIPVSTVADKNITKVQDTGPLDVLPLRSAGLRNATFPSEYWEYGDLLGYQVRDEIKSGAVQGCLGGGDFGFRRSAGLW